MRKLLFFILIFTFFYLPVTANSAALKDKSDNAIIKNKLFSIEVPNELKGVYKIIKERDKISFYHIDSMKAGFGGFAFGIKAYKNPADHAVLPGSKKLGELVDKYGNIYDIVLKHPTDVQYDYTKSSKAPESFKLLYELGDNADIKGINNSVYFKNQGMLGKDLYKAILEKHKKAIYKNWDSTKLEKENISYMYNIIPKDKVGYAYYDINADGIEELVIGEIADGEWKGVIYDIYTMADRKPQHVISGGSRDRYYVCDDSFICNEYSSGANESGVIVYNLVENSTELYPQVSFKYDGYENSKNPYFISYSDGKWENVPKTKFYERKKVFEKYERFNYTPLISEMSSPKLQNNVKLVDRYNPQKEYFDYSEILKEYPKDYYYTTVKINKSKERILIITDKVDKNNCSYRGLFYYFGKNGFVYPLGYIESAKPFSQSKNYIIYNNGKEDVKFYISNKGVNNQGVNSKGVNNQDVSNKRGVKRVKPILNIFDKNINNIEFNTIKSADKFAGDFGSSAGNDIKTIKIDGFYFEYHKPQYKKKYIKNLMKECIEDGVKTQVQMYCCVVNKIHS